MMNAGPRTGDKSVDEHTLRASHVGVMGVVRYAVSGTHLGRKGLPRKTWVQKTGIRQTGGVI